MDSRLRGLTIAAASGVIILVLLIVIYNNGMLKAKGTGGDAGALVDTSAGTSDEDSYGAEQTFEGYRIGSDLGAFKRDESFFDKEETKYDKYIKKHNTLSIVPISVEKDLKIKILDFDGKPVKDQELEISIEGKGDYKDTDKDGVIYIPYLKPGDYSITLKELEGFTVPEEPVLATVKAQVEYIPLEDIQSLIKTENDIDPKKDDTRFRDMEKDTDASEIRTILTDKENAVVGVDISKFSGEIDWKKVKDAGIKYAIIRCGYRGYTTGHLVEDPRFKENLSGAIDAGIDVGIYFTSQAINQVEAVEEASMVLNQIKREYINYPVFINSNLSDDKGRADKLTDTDRTAIIKAFCETIESQGYTAGVYASKNWLNEELISKDLEKYCIWLAEYKSAPTYDGVYTFWQYTAKGTVPGIEGEADLNLSYYVKGKNN